MASSSASRSSWASRPAWEFRQYADECDDVPSDDELIPEQMSAEDCSLEYFNYIVHLKLTGVLSSKQACVLTFWARGGGLVDPGASLALHPSQTGGNFSTHFDKVVGLDKELKKEFYNIDMPMLQKFSLGRVVSPCPASEVYKDLKAEVEATPRFFDTLEEQVKTEAWGPQLRGHKLAQQHDFRNIVPLGLYLDGVPFLKRDSALGIWLINLATTKRHLALVLRKRQTCRCSCQGWCTLFAAFEYLRWLAATMVNGTFPGRRHDGSPWAEGDPNKALGGSPLGYRACVLMVKGDWPEFANTLAYPTWASHKHPCFACSCTGGPDGDWQKTEGVSVLSLPWLAKGSSEYSAACAAAEVRVTVPSAAVWHDLLGHLRFDHRKSGSHGRALVVDFPPSAW